MGMSQLLTTCRTVNQRRLLVPKINLQVEAVRVLDDGAHHGVLDLSVVQVDADRNLSGQRLAANFFSLAPSNCQGNSIRRSCNARETPSRAVPFVLQVYGQFSARLGPD
jgi:hypothetical protein